MAVNKEIEYKLMQILSEDPTVILLIDPKYLTDNLWRISIQKEPSLFQYMKDPSQEMCMYALKEDGENLKWVVKNRNIHLTTSMIWTAVKRYPAAIFYVPSEYQTDALKEFAFDLDPSLMRHFPKIRRKYIRKKIRQMPGIVKYIKNIDESLLIEAIRMNPMVVSYIQEFTPRVRHVLEMEYPELVSMLPNLQSSTVSTPE